MKLHDHIIERLRKQAERHQRLYLNDPTCQYYEGLMVASNDALRDAVGIVEFFGKHEVIDDA